MEAEMSDKGIPLLPRGLIPETIMDEVNAEAKRAHEKHDLASMVNRYMSDADRYPILAEETGEVARAMNELMLHNTTQAQYDKQVRGELIQVAAMAVSWVLAIDDGRVH